MKYIIDDTLVNGLVNYLQERPYKEVAMGLEALKKLEPLAEKLEPLPNSNDKGCKNPIEVV